MTNALHLIASLLLAISIAAIAGVLYLYFPLATRFLDYKARQDCAVSYRLEFTDVATNTTITQPVEDLYKACLSEKGIS